VDTVCGIAILTTTLQNILHDLIAEQSAIGTIISTDKPTITGFPFRIIMTLLSPNITDSSNNI
jgi:hypothetical protein